MGCQGNTGGKEGTRGSGLSTSDAEIGKTQRSRYGGVRGVRGHRKFNLGHVEFEVTIKHLPQLNL